MDICAGVVIVTINRCEQASAITGTRIGSARVVIVANNRAINTPSFNVAVVFGAIISVVAIHGCVNAAYNKKLITKMRYFE